MLDDILQYHETPQDDGFVAEVVKGVKRQQRIRKLILTTTSLVGAAFGAAGMLMISDSISQLLSSTNVLPISVALVGVAVFMAWLFQDEVTASG